MTASPLSSATASSSTSLSVTLSSPSPDSQAQSSTSTSPVTPSATGTSTPKSNNTKIGAAVGAPLAVVSVAFIVLLVWFLGYRRRTKVKLMELQEQLAASERYAEKEQQLQNQIPVIVEMSAAERRLEMGAGGSHELPAGAAS